MIDAILHLDAHLNQWAADLGPWLYVLLFAIVFCETGLVVTPFLPGDSLLFALGAMTSTADAAISLSVVAPLLIVAGIVGDGVNYAIGNYLGPRVFRSETSRWLNRKHLERTQHFYEKYGGKTIVLARFIPIIRTFAPFVAGVGKMRYLRFAVFNVGGAVAWVASFLALGHFFGNIPSVKRNFSLVIVGIMVVSTIPVVVEYLRARAAQRAEAGGS